MLGITGSIGSGKSTVSKLFSELGAVRISSDEIAKQFTDPNTPIKKELVQIFGESIFDSSGAPIKSKIADIAFSEPEKLQAMNSLIHPLVRKEFRLQLKKILPGNIIAWEVPLLFETDAHTLCDGKLCVTVSPDAAWERVKERGGMTREDFEKRNLAQMDLEKKKALSDFVIPNDNSIEELKKKVKSVYETIRNTAKDMR
ncbi:dephospho-CoA kinase [Leptospira ilyithenensis]|uniref:Dephospho-CoA kinase n=1 Tax=Leptospira ilyithenensis TaxID=2484901 RepID=A0A4R9LU54_9LEPT|nr:dephospho-CoA kinase [Leptospira ilyithenensis]